MIRLLTLALLLLTSAAYAGQGMGPGPGFRTYAASPVYDITDFNGGSTAPWDGSGEISLSNSVEGRGGTGFGLFMQPDVEATASAEIHSTFASLKSGSSFTFWMWRDINGTNASYIRVTISGVVTNITVPPGSGWNQYSVVITPTMAAGTKTIQVACVYDYASSGIYVEIDDISVPIS